MQGVMIVLFAGFVIVFAKIFFNRKHAQLAAAKQKSAPLPGANFCPTCGRRMKGREHA